MPLLRVACESAPNLCDGFIVRKRDRAGVCFNDESRVTFFLPGNDVIDDHRASSGDSFLDRRATGFTNEQMISAKQTRHLIGPTENIDFAVARRFLDRPVKFLVATHGDS